MLLGQELMPPKQVEVELAVEANRMIFFAEAAQKVNHAM